MTFNDYQKKARKTAVYPNQGKNFLYPAMGLGGEIGEVLNKIGKLMRGDRKLTDEVKNEIGSEMGDVLWFMAQLGTELGLSLDEIADRNLDKLKKRYSENKIKGNGDNR